MSDSTRSIPLLQQFDDQLKTHHGDVDAFLAGKNSVTSDEERDLRQHAAQVNAVRELLAGNPAPSEEVPDDKSPPEIFPQQFGPFVLTGRIGVGGMGIIYRGYCSQFGEVAIKKLKFSKTASPREIGRFQREAESLKLIAHPNVVRYLEHGEIAEVAYLCMEYIGGENMLHAARRPTDRSQSQAIAGTFSQLARGLQAAHTQNILHRDIKPENIMFERDVPVLVDFGLARRYGREETFTKSGEFAGTLEYLAPEILRDQDASPQSDVYSLGAALYFALCQVGVFPQKDEDELRHAIQYDAPLPPRKWNPHVTPDLEAICLKSLEKNPQDRYRSAAEFAEELERCYRGERVVTQRRADVAVKKDEVVRNLKGSWAKWKKPTRYVVLGLGAAAVIITLGILSISGTTFWAAHKDWRASTSAQQHVTALQLFDAALVRLERAPEQGNVGEALANATLAAEQLERELPEHAQHNRGRLEGGLVKVIESHYFKVAHPSVHQEQDVTALLDALAKFNPSESNRLNADWQRFQHEWQTVYSTAAPDKELRFQQSSLTTSPQWALSNLDFQGTRGDVEFRCELHALEPGSWINLRLVGESQPLATAMQVIDGKPPLVVAGYSDGRVYRGHPWSGVEQEVGKLTGPVTALCALRDSDVVAAADELGNVVVFRGLEKDHVRQSFPKHKIIGLQASPSGDEIFIAATAGEELSLFSWKFSGAAPTILAQEPVEGPPHFAISTSCKEVALLSKGNVVRFRDDTGNWTSQELDPNRSVADLHWLGNSLLIGFSDGEIHGLVGDPTVKSSARVRACGKLQLIVEDGEGLAASATIDGRLELWNTKTWQRVGGPWNGSPCRGLAFVRSEFERGLVRLSATGEVESRNLASKASPRFSMLPGTNGYSFLFQRSFSEGPSQVRIFSGAQLLAEQECADLGAKCQIQASREGRLLSASVAGTAVCSAEDLLAGWQKRGRFAAALLDSQNLTSLIIRQRRVNPAASQLESSDLLAADEKFADALDQYRKLAQVSATPDVPTRHEASFKAALCLAQLGRLPQARMEGEALLREVGAKDSLRPYLLFWLWREYARATDLGREQQMKPISRLVDALDRDFTLQAEQSGRQQIRHLIPRADITELSNWNLDLLYAPIEGVTTTETEQFVWKAGNVLGDPPLLQVNRQLALCESLWMTDAPALDGHLNNALAVLRTYQQEAPDLIALGDLWTQSERLPRAIERSSWRNRVSGSRSIPELISELKQWIGFLAREKIPAGAVLYLELARLHHLNQDPAEAESVLQELLANASQRVDFSFGYYAQALLMLGFLREEQGNSEAAREVWERAKYPQWQLIAVGNPLRDRPESDEEFFGRLYGFAAVSVLQKTTPQHVRDMKTALLTSLRKTYSAEFVSLLQVAIDTRWKMEKWERYGAELAKSPEAQELIRVGIWKSKGFDDVLEEPARYAALEIIRQDLKEKELEADERELITEFVQAGIKLTLAGEIRPMQKKKELFDLIDIWDSADSSVDLVGILLGSPEGRLTETLRDLPPELGPPLAYLFARRFLTAQKPSAGKKMLDLAANLNSHLEVANPHVQKLLPRLLDNLQPAPQQAKP